jgi:hypothetical protein
VIDTGYKPRDFQKLVHRGAKRFNCIIVHRRGGKCLTASTDVLTTEGWKKINEIVPGDFVYGSDGNPTEVTGTYCGGEKQIYEVEFKNKTVIETDGDHLWYVEPPFSKARSLKARKPWLCGEEKTTAEIMKHGEVAFIPVVPVDFKEQELPIEPWLFGYWLGNGSKDAFLLTIGYQDTHLMDGLNYSNVSDYNGGCKRYYFSGMMPLLKGLGVYKNKLIPSQYLRASKEQRIKLLQGLLDSDGSVDQEGNCLFHNKNKVLIYQTCELIASLGMIPYPHASDRGWKGIEYSIRFSAKGFNPLTLTRKSERCRLNERPIRHRIVKVRKTDRVEPVYCIKVASKDELFLVSKDLIPTHNTVLCVNEVIDRVVNCTRKNPQGAYCAPTYGQTKRIAWQYFKDYTKAIPGVQYNEAELRVDIPRKEDVARIYLLGADNPDSHRGMYFDVGVLDEFDQMDLKMWTEVVLPALADRDGTAFIVGTPKGQKNLFKIYEYAKAHPEQWFSLLLKQSESNILKASVVDELRAMMDEDEFQQEMEVSFNAGITGSFYKRQFQFLDANNRICSVPHDPRSDVCTYWDLGISDTTCIWFVQHVGKELHVIDFLEDSGVDISFYAKALRELPYVYHEHVLPHDAAAREFQTGKSRIQALEGLKVRPIRCLPRHAVYDGIGAVRQTLPMCWFDKEKCAIGINHLRNYVKTWDTKNNMFSSQPAHDKHSHAADAFRTFAMGQRDPSRTKDFLLEISGKRGEPEAVMGYDPFGGV